MAVTPYEFESRASLVERLRRKKDKLAEWFEKRLDLDSIVRNSFGSNTWRAFHHAPNKPSVVIRSWAREVLEGGDLISELSAMSSQGEYDTWVKDLSKGFHDYWEQSMRLGYKMAYGPGAKVPNLLMKHFVLWEEIPNHQRSKMIGFLHVPLDSFSLMALRHCVAQSKYSTIIGKITKDAKMGFVTNESKYDALQSIAREVAQEADVPTIYLDVLAWDSSHEIA